MLSSLSVSCRPGSRLRHWCSSIYLRIPPLHMEFHYPLLHSSYPVSDALLRLKVYEGFHIRLRKPPALSLRPINPDNALATYVLPRLLARS